MAHTYVVSSQKSTAVHHAVTCNFISPEDTNIIVVKSNKIEVFSLASECLHLKIKTSLYGKITSLIAYRPRTSKTDVLFVLTESKFFCVLGFDPVQEVLTTLAKGNVKDRVGNDVESGQRALLDPENRMIGMLLYDGLLKVLPMGPNGNFQEAFNVPLEEPRLIDIAFLHHQPKPTFCLLFEDNKMGRHTKTYTIDIREKILSEGLWQQKHVEFSARMLIPVNEVAGGVLVVGQSTITYCCANANTHSIGMDHKFITAFCPLDSKGERYLLGDKNGVLSLLILLRNSAGGATGRGPGVGEVSGLVLEELGVTSIAERICYMDGGMVFVGSCFGDSQLVKLLSNVKESEFGGEGNNPQLEVVETYDNIGPIIDMCVVPSERLNQSQVVTCSGAYKDGSLRVIKSGIGIREQACIEMEGIKGIWSLRQPSSEACADGFDKYLVQAYAWETRVLWIDEDDEMGECEISGFNTEVTTLFCGNMLWQPTPDAKLEHFLVQATPVSVRLLSAATGELLSEVKFEKKIMVAEGNSSQVVVALSGGELIYLELTVSGADLSRSTKLVQVGCIHLDQDIACMSIRPEVCLSSTTLGSSLNHDDIDLMELSSDGNGAGDSSQSLLHPAGKSSLLVVGFWTDNSVRLFALPTLVEVTRVSLGVDVQVRSVLLASLSRNESHEVSMLEKEGSSSLDQQGSERNVYLLVGLGDGRVFTYILKVAVDGILAKESAGLPLLSDRQEVQLGSRPISFSLFVHDQALCVFACCDRPTVIFSRSRHNAKLLFSPVNITGDVTQMAPFHSQCFPNCLAMSSESGLLIGTIDSLQTIHIQSYHLNESPRHICYHEQTATYVVCSTKTDMTARGESIQDRILFLDNKDFVTRCIFELDPNETAMSCVSLVFDVPLSSSTSASASAHAGVEYVVIGTAYVLPEEQQPSRGRMLVFEVHTSSPGEGEDEDEDEEGGGASALVKRTATLVAETVTRGAVFCLASMQGKLVAGIDSQVLVYQFFRKGVDGAGSPDLVVLCEHMGHIMSLFCKTAGDLVLVGDILRSISVLQLIKTKSSVGTEVTSLKEVSRDFNSNYMRAVEMLGDDFFLGAEDNGNLFIVKRPGADCVSPSTAGLTLTEEEKSRLEMQSAFHLADFVNVFQRGMLGCNNSNAKNDVSLNSARGKDAKVSIGSRDGSIAAGGDSLGSGVAPMALFGTVSGCLGAVFTLSAETFHFLDVLEKSLNQVIRGLGGLSHEDFRQFSHTRRRGHHRRTIDGDLVEMFLDLPEAQMRQVTKHLNDELRHMAVVGAQEAAGKGPSKASGEKAGADAPVYSLNEVIQRLEELVRLH